MTDTKVHDAAWNLTTAVRDTQQAIADSAVAVQERNLKFAQGTFEDGIEVLKSHAESTRTLMQELTEQPKKGQGVFQTVVDSAVGAQERNIRFAQSVFENGIEVLKSHAEDTRGLAQVVLEQSQKQQEAFQTLARESVEAYVDFLYAPFAYYKQAVDTAQSIAREGMETAQRITRQGAEVAQKTTRQAQHAAEKATR